MKRLYKPLAICGSIYIIICLSLYMFQGSIIFKPDREYTSPDRALLPDIKEIRITTADDLTHVAWFHPPDEGETTALYLHGNAGGLTERTSFYQQFINDGYGVLALSYRGYFGNEGTPSETGLYEDARAAIQWLQQHNITSEEVILFGRSLGSGVATQMATEYPVKAIALISPYTSITDIGAKRYPFVPISKLLTHRFDSLARIENITAPIFIFHGAMDKVIPVEHTHTLFNAANTPKFIHIYPQANHSNVPFTNIIEHIRKGLENLEAQ